jgi:hypothetical protein
MKSESIKTALVNAVVGRFEECGGVHILGRDE